MWRVLEETTRPGVRNSSLPRPTTRSQNTQQITSTRSSPRSRLALAGMDGAWMAQAVKDQGTSNQPKTSAKSRRVKLRRQCTTRRGCWETAHAAKGRMPENSRSIGPATCCLGSPSVNRVTRAWCSSKNAFEMRPDPRFFRSGRVRKKQ